MGLESVPRPARERKGVWVADWKEEGCRERRWVERLGMEVVIVGYRYVGMEEVRGR